MFLLGLVLLAPDSTLAQCGNEWSPQLGTGPAWSGSPCFFLDLDGTGPDGPVPVVANSTNVIALVDGQWVSIAEGFTGNVYSLAVWDDDGAGPHLPQLVVAGSMQFPNSLGSNIARWDGTAWRAMGGIMNGAVSALFVWDADGAGPLEPILIAAGEFTFLGSSNANHIARWNGTTWSPLGGGLNGSVSSLVEWDPDGSGPLTTRLVAAGGFTTAGGNPAIHVAYWDGADWHGLGTGVGLTTHDYAAALAVVDPDGDGPHPAHLVAAGRFNTEVTPYQFGTALWNGVTWIPLDGPSEGMPPGGVAALATVDPDGNGPAPDQLIAARTYAENGGIVYDIAAWGNNHWTSMGRADGAVTSVAAKPVSVDSQQTLLIVTGEFASVGGVGVSRIAQWNGACWSRCSGGMVYNVSSLTVWDPDGSGQQHASLIAGGAFWNAGGIAAAHIARWDGERWSALGVGTDDEVLAATGWDPDGEGPQPAKLIAAGAFRHAGGVAVGRIAQWDGAGWMPLGSGLNNYVYALAQWDPDGEGPQPSVLIGGGAFTTAGGATASHIAQWNGTAWSPLGNGLAQAVRSLTVWDPDGPGPLPTLLVAATRSAVSAWNGSAWTQLGGYLLGTTNEARSLVVWDGDAEGPEPSTLVVGGDFQIFVPGGTSDRAIFRWDGTSWVDFAAGIAGPVSALTTWDLYQSGVRQRYLIAGGELWLGASGTPSIALWDGVSWSAIGSGTNDRVRALAAWDCGDARSTTSRIVIGGDFTRAGPFAAPHIAMFGCSATAVPMCVSDLGQQGGIPGADGVLNNNDFIVFIDMFFSGDPLADFGGPGGVPPGEGEFNNNDFCAFINAFFEGCP